MRGIPLRMRGIRLRMNGIPERMKGTLLGLLLLGGGAQADPLLDKTRSYYAGLKTYQVRIHCQIYKGLVQGQPELETETRISAALPSRLRFQAVTLQGGKKLQSTHIFDGTWQWILSRDSSGETRARLQLKKALRAGSSFDTGLYIPASGLVDGADLVASVQSLLEEPGLRATGQQIQAGGVTCSVYSVPGEHYWGDNLISIYLDSQGILRGYRELEWTDEGKELTAVVQLDEFHSLNSPGLDTFKVDRPAAYPDITPSFLKNRAKEDEEKRQLASHRMIRVLKVGDLRNARRLVKAYPELLKQTFTPLKLTPLQLAAGHLPIVQWLISVGVDPGAPDAAGLSALHYSTSLEEWQCYREHGVDFAAVQARCPVPLLMLAFSRGNPAMVKFLQQQGIKGPLTLDRAMGPWPLGWTLTHAAASSPQPEVLVPLALQLGAQPGARSADGVVPLHLLFERQESGARQAISELLRAGADVDAPDSESSSLLMKAVAREDLGDVEYLLSLGANPNRILGGSSAMHDAAVAGEPKLLQMLLGAKGDPNLRGEQGWTPLHCAAYWGRVGHCQLLLQAGARPSLLDDHGQSPWQVTQNAGVRSLLPAP